MTQEIRLGPSGKDAEELRMHFFVLFKDLKFKKFTPELRAKVKKITSDIGFYNYFSKNIRELMEILKKNKKVMSAFKKIKIQDELAKERYVTYILRLLAETLAITALRMEPDGLRFIIRKKKWVAEGSKPYYLVPNMLSKYFLKEYCKELGVFKEKCSKIKIKKEDIIRLSKSLSRCHPHKTGWLEE